jgi:chemotaxis signal transduction protein
MIDGLRTEGSGPRMPAEAGGAPDPALKAAQVLRQRAHELARPLDQADVETRPERAMVVFAVGVERYALRTEEVQEVIALINVAPVPRTPPTIAGVTNHRGRIVPIIDLRPLSGGERRLPPLGSAVVLVAAHDTVFGLLADQILGVLSLPYGADERATEGLSRGLVGDGIVVLNPDAVALDPRIAVDVTP